MVKTCCALHCRSSSSRDFKLSFHKFPRNLTRKRLWLKALKKVNWEPTPNTYVCSKHFTEDCYDKKRPEIRLLLKTAIPVLFGPNSSPVKKTKEKESKKNKDENVVRPLVVHIKSSDIDENGIIDDIHDDILRMKETLPNDTSPIASKADDNSETVSEDDDESLQTLVSGGSDFREIMKKVPPEKKKLLHSKLYEPEESDDKEILQFKLLAVLDILKQKDKQIRELKEKNRLLLKSNQSMSLGD